MTAVQSVASHQHADGGDAETANLSTAEQLLDGGRVQWGAMIKPLLEQLVTLQATMPTGKESHGATAKWADSMRKLLGEVRELDDRAGEGQVVYSLEEAADIVMSRFIRLHQALQTAENACFNELVRQLQPYAIAPDTFRPALKKGVSDMFNSVRNMIADAMQTALDQETAEQESQS